MRKIKGSNSYLRSQTIKNLAKATLSITIFGVVIFALTLRALSTLRVDVLEGAGLILSLAPLAGFYFYLRKYRIYRGGLDGEMRVAKLLTSMLSDDYYLINGLSLHNGGGDIDHVVLGPNGVFVLETKNWSGNITCNGDDWQRLGKKFSGNPPSLQVKRNVARIKHIISRSSTLRLLSIPVEGIVVFTNKHAALRINCPTVAVLRLTQLPNHIVAYGSPRRYSCEQLEAVGKEFIKARH